MNTVNPHYSQILYLWISVLSKIYPQCFCGHSQTCEEWQKPWVTYPARSKLRLIKGPLPSCFSLHTINKCPFCELFNVTLFTFVCHFLLVISLFKMAPELCPETMFLRARRLWCALQGKYVWWISLFQAWIIVLLAVSSMLMSQQYIFKKVSLNGKTH